MAIDDRKQRILTAIVALHATDGEPVGSNLLSRYFDMAVSSATLRNEMAALTKLGLLEQPHTSAGRVPTAKGYRYYVDHLIGAPPQLTEKDKQRLDQIFAELDYDPEKLAQGAAKALSNFLGFAVATSTPRADDMFIAHYEVIQVGRYSAAILAVTGAGGVRTRVAKLDFEITTGDILLLEQVLNQQLRFIAEADVSSPLIQQTVSAFGNHGAKYWPVVSAALSLLSQAGVPSIFFEGQQTFLQWAELEPYLRILMEISSEPEKLEHLIQTLPGHTTILFGEEFAPKPIPGLCILSRQYLAGGGRSGMISVLGPSRMNFCEVLPKLEYFSHLMGQSMSGTGS